MQRDLHTGDGKGATLTNNKIKRGKGTLLVSFENALPPANHRPLPVPYLEHQIGIDYYNYMRPLFKLHPCQQPTPFTNLVCSL
jgi:hypothetical protein